MTRKRAVDLLDAKHDPVHKELPPPTKARFRRGQVKRRRRCVRIEAVDEAGKVAEAFIYDGSNAGIWVRDKSLADTKRDPFKVIWAAPTLWRARNALRDAGYTRIRKVYEEVK